MSGPPEPRKGPRVSDEQLRTWLARTDGRHEGSLMLAFAADLQDARKRIAELEADNRAMLDGHL